MTAALSFLLPGLGHLLTRQFAAGIRSFLLAALIWTLTVSVSRDGPLLLTALCAAAAVTAHVGAGISARSGAAAHGQTGPALAAANRAARQDQRRWSTLSSAAAATAVLAVTLHWAVTLPGWSETLRNVPFFLIGRLRAEEYDPLRWRLIGLALPAAGALIAWTLGRVRRAGRPLPAWPGALSVTAGLVGCAVITWPLLMPETVLGGFALSLVLTVLALLLAAPIGLIAGVLRVSRLPLLRLLATAYIDLLRAVPLIVWVFAAFLLLPYLLGNGTQFLAVVLALAGFTGAYFGEIVRAGLQALPPGQNEAARSLGLSGTQTMRLVVLPQALRLMIPPLLGQTITLFKDTSLVSIVGLVELAGAGRITANRLVTSTFEIYLLISLLYFAVAAALSAAAARLERAPHRRTP